LFNTVTSYTGATIYQLGEVRTIAIVSSDGRHIDLVVVFLYNLDVARKLDGFRRIER
jgi:hypothetical protein